MMTTRDIENCNREDALFEKYRGTLRIEKGKEPSCGYRQIMDFVKSTGEKLPLTPQRMAEIEKELTVPV